MNMKLLILICTMLAPNLSSLSAWNGPSIVRNPNFMGCYGCNPENFRDFIRELAQTPSIRHIRIYNSSANTGDIQKLAQRVCTGHVQSLILDGSFPDSTHRDLEHLINFTKLSSALSHGHDGSSLTSLSLSNLPCDKLGFQYFTTYLIENPSLQTLILNNITMDDSAIRQLLDLLIRSNISTLSLSGQSLDHLESFLTQLSQSKRFSRETPLTIVIVGLTPEQQGPLLERFPESRKFVLRFESSPLHQRGTWVKSPPKSTAKEMLRASPENTDEGSSESTADVTGGNEDHSGDSMEEAAGPAVLSTEASPRRHRSRWVRPTVVAHVTELLVSGESRDETTDGAISSQEASAPESARPEEAAPLDPVTLSANSSPRTPRGRWVRPTVVAHLTDLPISRASSETAGEINGPVTENTGTTGPLATTAVPTQISSV